MPRRRKKDVATVAPVEAAPPAVAEPRSPLAVATGTDHAGLARILLSDAVAVSTLGAKPDSQVHDERAGAAFGLMESFAPRDGVEGMLASQITALHSTGMAALRRAVSPDLPPEIASRLRRDAVAAFRAVSELVEAIEARRGNGGRQTIRVEHVERAIFTGREGGHE